MDTTLLWQHIKKGNKNAFNQLFKSFYSGLKAYGIKVAGNNFLAEEAIQILFVKIWERRENLGEVKSIKSYLIKAYRRTLIDLIKAEKKQASIGHPTPLFQISPEDLSIFHQESKENAQKIASLINQLPDNQKEIIYLRYYNQLSYLEIAEIIDLNYQSVRNYGVKAIQFLRKNWEK